LNNLLDFNKNKIARYSNTRYLLNIVLFISGFLAVQRFSAPMASSMIAAIPLVLSAIFIFNKKYLNFSLSCSVLAIIFLVDNGAGVYSETPSIIRYSIYFVAITNLALQTVPVINLSNLFLYNTLIIIILIGALLSQSNLLYFFDYSILKRDLFLLFIFCIFVFKKRNPEIDLDLVYFGTLGFFLGELINILFLYSDYTEYLSYDTTKMFVLFPAIYSFMTQKSISLSITLTLLGILICFVLGTRMIVISLLALSFIALFCHLLRGSKLIFFIPLIFFLLFVFPSVNFDFLLNMDSVNRFKSFGFIVQILTNTDGFELIRIADPARFGEHIIFFDRSWYFIVLGQGLGSGIQDINGVLGFVSFDDTAFSSQELRTGIFFNFHDIWLDLGIRFGLIFVLFVFYKLIFQNFKNKNYAIGIFFGLLAINITFSMSGIILTVLLFRFFPQNIFIKN
jgi:hypothetical protein